MLAHIDGADPLGLHHLLPVVAAFFGTLGMYWLLGVAWLRDKLRHLVTLAKGLFGRLK